MSMNLITVEGLTHSYTDRMLFKEASFSLNEHEKVGIIGINGTGKSTLLKILAGQEIPDQGTMITRRNLRIAYLPQQPEFEPGETMLMGALPRKEEISGNPAEYEADAKSYLGKLGLTQYDQPVSQLSGGQRKRVALVRVLLTPCDVLVLDEPTNHLDGAMSQWLEDHLKNMKTELIMVTHDRYFLDSVVNRIVEIDKGSLYSYSCNYSGFLERKAEREEIEKANERKRQSVLRKEIAWMQRGARARSTKQKAHIARYEMLRDQEAPEQDRQVEIVAGSSRLGKTTIECENIWKGYDDRTLIRDFTYNFLRHDRVGIIGPNGCGKSTLIKMIVGQETPDQGRITIGQTVKIGYFSQESDQMDPDMRVIDYVKEGGEVLHTSEGTMTATVLMERFLFTADQQYSRIGKLSGGEKRRLYLLRILMEAPNVLILDEPTNDLDITTLALLEDYLDGFDGIVLTVSHDRYFLDRVVNRIFAFEGGTITQYEGGYTDYQYKSGGEESLQQAGQAQAEEKKVNRSNWKEGQEKKLKMSYKEQREYETIEQDINDLEEKIQRLEEETLACATDFVKLGEITKEKEEAENQLMEKMERWEYLEELAEQIAAGK